MPTLKLKNKAPPSSGPRARPPLRGAGVSIRPRSSAGRDLPGPETGADRDRHPDRRNDHRPDHRNDRRNDFRPDRRPDNRPQRDPDARPSVGAFDRPVRGERPSAPFSDRPAPRFEDEGRPRAYPQRPPEQRWNEPPDRDPRRPAPDAFADRRPPSSDRPAPHRYDAFDRDRGRPAPPQRSFEERRPFDRGDFNRGPFERRPYDNRPDDSRRWPQNPSGPNRFDERPQPARSFERPSFDRGPSWDDRRGPPGYPDERPRRPPQPVETIGPRLSKRMSELGLSSRREADEWIPRGWVRVDGRVVSQLGARVHPDSVITLDPRARSEQASRITVLLHKPLDVVSGQAEDGHEPAIALIRADTQWTGDGSGRQFEPDHLRYLAPAGRLDLDSTGLLVLTQDGRVARVLVGEDRTVDKTYLVRIEPMAGHALLDEAGLARMRHGLELDDEPLLPAEVEWAAPGQLRVVLREGKKRQIRRMAEAVGQRVVELVRVAIGRIELGPLPPGRWRYLRDDESFT